MCLALKLYLCEVETSSPRAFNTEIMDKKNFFIDESGDASFYAKRKKLLVAQPGFQPLLNLGMVVLEDKKRIRQAVIDFQNEIKSDPLYNSLKCVQNPKGWYLHACNDSIEIRAKFIEFLRGLEGFEAYIVIGRKMLSVFHNKHNANEKEFYFDLVHHLLKGRMDSEDEDYQIFLAAIQRKNQKKLLEAINKAIRKDNESRVSPLSITFSHNVVRSSDTPELSITDYMLWALQRYILLGESRYFKALSHKYKLIIDLYDEENEDNVYDEDNIFDLDKAGEFKTNGYI